MEAEFDAADAEGAGSIDAARLVSLIGRMGTTATREQADRAMGHLDGAGSGRAPKVRRTGAPVGAGGDPRIRFRRRRFPGPCRTLPGLEGC